MRKSVHAAVRAALRERPDGATINELVKVCGRTGAAIRRALLKMPDAYLDRWEPANTTFRTVWCVVVPPPDCPRPEVRRAN